jgi:hypothetical protein
LVAVENTLSRRWHRRAPGAGCNLCSGGVHGVATRWMARASGMQPWRCPTSALADPFDVVWAALSKDRRASRSCWQTRERSRVPCGSGVVRRDVQWLARRCRRLITLHYDRLADDHAGARLIAEQVALSPRVRGPPTVQTNIVVFHLRLVRPRATIVARPSAVSG